jgi:hypothetical protein
MATYAIRFRGPHAGHGVRTYLMANGYTSHRFLWAWTAPSARLARKCARLLCLKGFDIVRIDHV